ncbi:MAG TPA: GNAT family N-acetyltransferase [Opitutaceae bacterium]|jgi:ribosomal protein S18 acetylase RimI-like enzyme|nr:GNAT family N-acetyltransferase [Opitutaceae bacterium]
MRYELIACTDRDREWAYALKSEAYREVVERQFGLWDEATQRDFFTTRWNPQISSVIVIEGEKVGLLAVEEQAEGLWLDEIQIVKTWRGRGLGTLIIQDLLKRGPLRLQVLRQNSGALSLYWRLGFRAEGENETHYFMRHPGSKLP